MNLLSLIPGLPIGKIGTIIKALLVLLVVGLIFGSGAYVGALAKDKELQVTITALGKDLRDAEKAHSDDKVKWAKTKEEMASAAATELAKSIEAAKAIEAKAQADIVTLQNKLANDLKRIKNEASSALTRVLNPVDSLDPLTDGMWVDVTNCASGDTGGSLGQNRMPEAPSGAGAGPFRCRLHPQVAERLIESASEANRLVAGYNSCVGSLKILSPQSFAVPVSSLPAAPSPPPQQDTQPVLKE